ncbi:MAG: HNH endonuclease [Thiohalomonadales bacterium]
MKHLLEQYDRELAVTYKGEHYRARDNGAVYRLSRPGKRKRKLDEVWTFGKPCKSSGYMLISSERVHRIVATGFHGVPPSKQLVVDHIDTNRRNNRPNNLRWLTKLENIILNPITARNIEVAYGTIENFFKNPKKPLNGELPKNYDWMRTVSEEEAKACKEKLLEWSNSNKKPSGRGKGEWLYLSKEEGATNKGDVLKSKTFMATQRNWYTPSEFLLCPDSLEDNPLMVYLNKLLKDSVFVTNKFLTARVYQAETNDSSACLSVICSGDEGSVKGWAVTMVYILDGKFCHEGKGTYFTIEGAKKMHYKNLGKNVDNVIGDCIDDYC